MPDMEISKIIPELAEYFEHDWTLLENIDKLYDVLSTPLTIRRQNRDHLDYGKFWNVLDNWLSRNGRIKATVQVLCSKLKEIGCVNLSERIMEKYLQPLVDSDQLTGDFVEQLVAVLREHYIKNGSPVNHFFGREDDITKVQHEITSYDFSCHPRLDPIIAITGMGGVGKTEFLKKILNRLPERFVVSFFHADNHDTLNTDLQEFVKQVNEQRSAVGLRSLEICQVFEEVSKSLKTHNMTWVIALDGCSDMDEAKEIFFLIKRITKLSNVFVIITAYRSYVPISPILIIELEDLTNEEGVSLMKFLLKNQFSDLEEINRLCGTLQNQPLCLNLAAAYIKKRLSTRKNYTIREFISEFNSLTNRETTPLSERSGDPNYTKTPLVIFDLIVQNLLRNSNRNIDVKILEILAFMHNEKRVSVQYLLKLLKMCTKKKVSEVDFNKSLEDMSSYFLISYHGSEISVHKIAQHCCMCVVQSGRCKSFNNGISNLFIWKKDRQINRAHELLDKILKKVNVDCETEQNLAHIRSIWSYAIKNQRLLLNHKGKLESLFTALKHTSDDDEVKAFASDTRYFINKFLKRNCKVRSKLNNVLTDIIGDNPRYSIITIDDGDKVQLLKK